MTKKLSRLLQQKAELEEQIKLAEQIEKHRNRVERMVTRTVCKHPELFTTEPTTLEKILDTTIEQVLKELGFTAK